MKALVSVANPVTSSGQAGVRKRGYLSQPPTPLRPSSGLRRAKEAQSVQRIGTQFCADSLKTTEGVVETKTISQLLLSLSDSLPRQPLSQSASPLLRDLERTHRKNDLTQRQAENAEKDRTRIYADCHRFPQGGAGSINAETKQFASAFTGSHSCQCSPRGLPAHGGARGDQGGQVRIGCLLRSVPREADKFDRVHRKSDLSQRRGGAHKLKAGRKVLGAAPVE